MAFSAYCWQLLSQQQRAFDLSVAAEMVLNRVNTDTVYLLGREKASDGSVQQRLSLLSSHLDRFVRLVREDPESVDDPGPRRCSGTSTVICWISPGLHHGDDHRVSGPASRASSALQTGTLPVGEAQYRDLTELMRLHHYPDAAGIRNEQRQLLQLQQHLLGPLWRAAEGRGPVRLGQEFNPAGDGVPSPAQSGGEMKG